MTMIVDQSFRFGLPLSLVEALRADSSPNAVMLADLLAQDEAASTPSAFRRARPGAAPPAGYLSVHRP